MKRYLPLIIGIIAVILFISGVSILFSRGDSVLPGSSKRTATIITTVAPTFDTTITINGDGVKEGETKVEPGTYTVQAAHKGFETESKMVTVKEGETVRVGIALQSNSPDTADWYGKNETDARKFEGISSTESGIIGQQRINSLPFLTRLPVRVPNKYTIDYGPSKKDPNNPKAVAITISYNDASSREAARNWIRYQGYDPDKLEIIYSPNRAQ